ncbi:hypothetical protein [Tenacibaculum maritimum]|uniref:HNH nuclease domain-containing protein n=1 Tax=Tenacibaculum maritimum NCIMB 2154 TaxID=1349785 RepID=A0A2H1E668_9FLAO|nr:hypothetical protein [Tenacibaculum maritimum]SFZ80256.1 conserved protein of unknown function [Tenacibaculum maritimum NCIMB 2154]
MIYLGEQKEALSVYSNEAICWLGIKIKGRKTKSKPSGYRCVDSECILCNSKATIRKNINQDYRDLFNNDLIKELIISKPKRLNEINNQLKQKYNDLGYTEEQFNIETKNIFINSGYTNWFLSKKMNYRLAKLLNKHTCTYCNREYIFVYKKNKGKGLVPQFDHWFPKTHHPLLSLSFYNLIPSCATCNTIKAEEEFSLDHHLHPYINKDISNSYKFDYIYNEAHIPEVFLRDNSLSGNNTFEALNLPFIYKGHSDKELKDLYDLRFKYSENYLKNLIKNTFDSYLPISDEEKYRLIFGIELNSKDYHKRVMSKFKNDIIEKLLSISNDN